jgi:membrane protein DedA with SNARE-associated domain
MIESLTMLLTVYRIPTVFFGAFFFGDSVVLTAAYLAGQLQWPVVPIFLAAFLGTAVADTMWFFAGVFLAPRFANMQFLQGEREKAAAFLRKLIGEKPQYGLILIKFVYTGRIAMILYVAARGLSFRIFAIYNSIGIALWLIVFFPLGYLAGRGVGQALPLVNAIEAAIVVLIVSTIGMRILTIWLTKRITKE